MERGMQFIAALFSGPDSTTLTVDYSNPNHGTSSEKKREAWGRKLEGPRPEIAFLLIWVFGADMKGRGGRIDAIGDRSGRDKD